MTNFDALVGIIGENYPFGENVFKKALIDQKLLETETYIAANERPVDFAAMSVILTVILRPNIQEGGFRLSDTDKNSLITVRNILRTKYGLPIDEAGIPKITGITPW